MRRLTPLVLALVLAGCGGSGGDARLSAADYRAKADAACARVDDELLRLPVKARAEGLGVQELVKRGRAITGRYVDTITGLRPPSDLADAHSKLAGHLEEFRAEDDRIPEPDATQRHNVELRADFTALGLKRCLATVGG